MSQLNVLILEDDAFEAKILKEYLEEYNFNIVKITNNILEATEIYYSHTIDFIIIDVFLNGEPEGITFVKTLLKNNKKLTTPFLFLTKHSERAFFESAKIIRSYRYIIKPFNEDELTDAIEIILEKYNNAIDHNILKKSTTSLPYFFKKNAIFHKVLPNDIFYIEVEGRYCKIITEKNNFISQYTLIEFKRSLPDFFLSVHRECIVNTAKIKEVHPEDNLIVLENNKTITLGYSYRNFFFDYYNTIK